MFGFLSHVPDFELIERKERRIEEDNYWVIIFVEFCSVIGVVSPQRGRNHFDFKVGPERPKSSLRKELCPAVR